MLELLTLLSPFKPLEPLAARYDSQKDDISLLVLLL